MHSPTAPPQNALIQPQTLKDLLLFRLSHYLAMASAPIIKICEGQFGISRREWRLLATLAESGAMNSSTLALRCGLDRARTSRAISSLEQKKLLRRNAVASDQRLVRIELSVAGHALHSRLWPMVNLHQKALLATFSDNDLAQLDSLLARLHSQGQTATSDRGELPKANRRAGRRLPFEVP